MASIDDDDIEVGEFDDDELADGFGEELISEEAPDLEDDSLEDDAIEDTDDALDADVVLAPVEKVVLDLDEDPEIELDVELALDEIILIPARFIDEVEIEDDEDTLPSTSVTEVIDTPLPRQPDEFRCTSCHLLKNVSQLADKDKILCRDCV